MQKLYATLLILLIAYPVNITGSDAPKPWIIKHENNDVSETYEEISERGVTWCELWKLDGKVYCSNSIVYDVFDDWHRPYEGEGAVAAFNELKKRYIAQKQQAADKK